MPRTVHPLLRDCYERANPYTEYHVEVSEPDVGKIIRRADEFVTPVSMTPASSLAAAARGALTLAPSTAALASFTGNQSSYDLNGEDAQRRIKGVSWTLDPAFTRATLKTVQAKVQRVGALGAAYPADFELQIFRITKTPGVKQKNVGTPQYTSTAWTEYAFAPLLNPAPVIKSGAITWDGSNKATLNFDCTNWGLVLENSLVRPVAPDQVGELPEYLVVVRLAGKAPAGTGHYRWLVDTATSRTVSGIGTFERTWWARESDQEQWARTAYADVPAITVSVESYPATGSAVFAIDQGRAPNAEAVGRVVFERSVPVGTSLALALSTAGATGPWTTVTHGDIPAIAQQTYHLKVTLNADASQRATPSVTALGVEFRIPRDVSIESLPTFPTREIDLPWPKASIAEGKLKIVRTGVRDYLDVATTIGSTDPTSRLECDIFLASKHPSVTRDMWHRMERLMVTNRTPMATSEELTLLSYSARLKRKIPRKVETLSSVHTVVSGSTAAQLIVTPALPGTSVSGNEYDGKNYYIRVRASSAGNTPEGFVATIQGNTSTDRLDFSPSLPEALVAGDVIEVHSGSFQTSAVSWSDYDPAEVWWEVLTDLLEIPSERVGAGWLPRGGKPPKVTDRAPGDATTQAKLKVTGRLSEQEAGDTIIEQLDAILGGVTLEIAGQIVFVQLVPLLDATGAVAVPLPSPVAVFDARDIATLSTPPGIEKRATIVSANYGVPATAASQDAYPSKTTTVVDNDALEWLDQQDLEDFGTAELPKEVSRWLYNSTDAGLYLATVTSAQLVRAASTGLRVWPISLIERHPEIVPGDVVIIITDQYTDYEPATQTPLRGPMAVRGVVVRCGNDGRQLALFVQSLRDNVQLLQGGAVGANSGLGRTPSAPVLSGTFDSTGQLIINSTGDDVTETQRIAYSTAGTPSAASVRAAPPLTGQVLTAATGSTYAPGQAVYIAAFAYNGNGVESLIAAVQVVREGSGAAAAPSDLITIGDSGNSNIAPVTMSYTPGAGGGSAYTYQLLRRSSNNTVATVEASGSNALNPLPRTVNVTKHIKNPTALKLIVTDTTTGLTAEADDVLPPIIAGAEAAGTGSGFSAEGRTRAGSDGGYTSPGQGYIAAPYMDETGQIPLLDPRTRRIQSGLSAPSGTGMLDVETGGNRGLGGFTDNTGALVSTAKDSASRTVVRLLAKTLSGDPDTLDGLPEGTSYKRTIASRVSSGKPLFDLSESIHINKNADNLPRSAGDTTPVSTVVSRIADTGHPDATMQATDGSIIEGKRGASQKAGAGKGYADEDGKRSGSRSGYATSGNGYSADPVMDSSGMMPLIDVANRRATTDLGIPGASLDPGSVTKSKTESRNRCKATATGTVVASGGASTAIQFNGEDFDTASMHDNATNNTRITIPSGGDVGFWLLTAQISFPANATGHRKLDILENGVSIAQVDVGTAGGGNPTVLPILAVLNAPAVGNYYEVAATQLSGGNLTCTGWFSAVHLW